MSLDSIKPISNLKKLHESSSSPIAIFDIKKILFTKSSLKKVLIGVGIIASVVVLCIVGLFMYIHSIGTEMDKTSRAYVDEAVSAISTDWNVDEIKKRRSSEFMSVMSDEELQKLFDYIEKNLGKMKVYLGSQGESRIFLNNLKKDITAIYTAKGEFEKGNASIYVSLIWKNNKWQILGYRVNSDVFKQY